MGIKKKYAKGRLDKYYHLAKEQGYRARSAFKLIQLNKKYNFLEKSKVLVDLCAAPGGWCQVAVKYMPKPSIIIGLDLAPIKPIPGVITHVEDITTPKCRATLKQELKTWKADVFLHDGAPNVGTSWVQDAFTQSELTLSALKLATEFLAQGGIFVSKVFRSKDYNKLMWVFNQLFDKVEATKPASSRNVSAEIFVVCQGFKAPKKIDPRFLDPKYVFKEVDDTVGEDDEKKKKERNSAILNDLFHPEKKRRHRDGYADDATILYTTTPAMEFIKSSDFVNILAKSNAVVFEENEEGQALANDPLTTEDVKSHISDLRVIGKKDFKDIIRWREAIRLTMGLDKSKEQKRKEAAEAEEKKKAELAAKVDTPESIAEELANQAKELQMMQKREKRKSRERKAKQLVRLRMGMTAPMDIGLEAEMGGIDGLQYDPDAIDHGTFPANGEQLKIQKAAVAAGGDEDDDEDDEEDDDSDIWDSDDETAAKIGYLEDDIDKMYESYQERLLEKDPKAKVKKLNDKRAEFEEWYGVEWEKKQNAMKGVEGEKGDDSDSDDDDDSEFSWEDESEDETAARKSKKRKEREDEAVGDAADDGGELSSAALSKKAKIFFDNPLFKNLATGSLQGTFAREMDLDEKEDESDEDEQIRKAAKEAKKKKDKKTKSKSKDYEEDEKESGKKGFEVVKATAGDETGLANSATPNFIIDTAQKYTLAQKVSTKSGKRDLIDDAFNRYAFNDPEGLPSWFLEDEGRHNKPQLPATKEAIEIMRSKLKAFDARPIKKVAEAKFRKKLRAQAKMDKALKKANAVAEDSDAPEMSKLKDAAKIMAKAGAAKAKKKVQVIVAKHANRAIKGRPKGIKGKYKMVDGVMKKEMRQQKSRDKKAKKGKGRR
ncbi:AdoMet-dependent rRNA methyltransferase spb1 [Blyttiomyces sp. JEL0837]|nr:AdoMet-dependent rRNA methyltransferase spb1 [Blyttiomyces sp. JEL0837]